MSASSASATAAYSAAGSAWAIAPPNVPRVRIWKWPMCGVAIVSSGTESATSSSIPTSAWEVVAPTRTAPSSRSMPHSSSTREMSMRLSKCVNRIASIGTRLWPPANTLASSPNSASMSAASFTDSGRW